MNRLLELLIELLSVFFCFHQFHTYRFFPKEKIEIVLELWQNKQKRDATEKGFGMN